MNADGDNTVFILLHAGVFTFLVYLFRCQYVQAQRLTKVFERERLFESLK